MQETETSKTKVSDSAYSNSSTSQYQRSNGSSKSRHSNSSGSSGYCGRPSVLSIGNDEAFPQPSQTCTKHKEKKRKQLKKVECLSSSSSWDHESGREGIEVVGGRTVTGVTSSITVVNGTSNIGPITGIPGMGAVVSSINTEVAPIMVNSKVSELQNGDETEALQMAALTQTLSCIKKMKGKDSTLKYLQGENVVQRSTTGPLDSRVKEHIANCLNGDTCSTQAEGEGFVVIVSMADGTVVHTTPNLTDTLGFPGDMWLGRDFIDFVHPKDRMAFAGHITSGVARGEDNAFKGLPNKTSFYCSLRQYRGLRNVGYGVTGKRVPYLPFQLTLTFREMNFSVVESQMVNSQTASPSSNSATFQVKQMKESAFKNSGKFNENVFLVITANRIYTAYKVPDEELVQPQARSLSPPQSPALTQTQSVQLHPQEVNLPLLPQKKFVTRHLSSCRLSHIDPAAVPYLGYLPQDMETRSVMDFYHPEDMPILKEAYHNVMSQQGTPYKGKPYRFRTQNGTYALIETEWSSFVNPWSRKLEFVIGQHCVMKGPSNPDVFAEPIEEECPQFTDEVLKESECIQEEILFMLDQKVTRVSESARQQVSRRCRDLASFMETIMDEMAKPADILRVELPAQDVNSISGRDSVMLGEISPHHDYYDGKSSTETPPSYNQLNYNENLQRFFESKPKTTLSDESSEMKIEGSSNNRSPNISTDEEGKISPIMMDFSSGSGRKFCSQANESESGGSESRARGGEGGAVGDSGHEDHGDPGGEDKGGGEGTKQKGKAAGNNEASNKTRNASGHEKKSGHGKSKTSHEKSRATNHNDDDLYHPPHLTEALLSRHNEDMEKIMVQKHREQRSLDKEGKLKDGRKSINDKSQDILVSHGVKRSGSHSWEGEPQRVKHQHIELPQQQNSQPGIIGQWDEHLVNMQAATSAVTVTGSSIAPMNTSISSAVPKNNKSSQPAIQVPAQGTMSPLPSLNLWPPFSVTLTPMHNSQPCPTYSCPGMGIQKNHIQTLSTSTTAANQPPQGTELPPPPPPAQFPLSLQHPLTPLKHQQGLIPVYYMPTAPMGVMPSAVDADNSSSHPHHVGYPPQQIQQQMPIYSYLVPSPHSQPPGIPSVPGPFYMPNHTQYLNTIPPIVYQTVGSAQVTNPASSQMLLQPINSFMPIAPPYPAPLSTPNPADSASNPQLHPAHHQSSASNLHYPRLRHSSKNHHAGQMLHHVRLPQAESAAAKGLARQMRGKDRQGVFLMAGRETLSNTAIDGRNHREESDGGEERGNSLLFPKCQRPASQDTSVKAEPGSGVGSITSASGLHDFSEVSKRFKTLGSSIVNKQNHGAEEEEFFRVKGREGMSKEDVGLIGDGCRGRHLYAFRFNHDQDTVCDDSSYSSLYSFLRSEKSDESMRSFPWDSKGDKTEDDTKDDVRGSGSKDNEKGNADKHAQKPLRKGPSWLEEVDVTPDLIFRYKMDDQILPNVLEADLKTLKNIHQSSTVNEQLSQLYMDMELEGAATKLGLEDSAGFTSSSGTDEASVQLSSFSMSPSPTKGKQEFVHRSKKKRRPMEYGKLVMIFEENAPFPPPLSAYSE